VRGGTAVANNSPFSLGAAPKFAFGTSAPKQGQKKGPAIKPKGASGGNGGAAAHQVCRPR
jgi:hypothetical protein